MSSVSTNSSLSIQSDKIERLFFKVTSPIEKVVDPNLINIFCGQVNSEVDGHTLAIRLISHKIQSPQEDEALRTLDLLEVCVLNCGRRFHQEIGKFRFLNEMIKLVSPKYLGCHTSDRVKKKVIELLYSWTETLPGEVKINEAYQMLKRQSIITEDPVYLNKNQVKVLPQRSKSIFDKDPEKSKTLERLLKSRKAEDLEQANALIKSLVKKDEEKIEKLSNRSIELEKIQTNINLLSEMLMEQKSSICSSSEKETLIYLHDQLEKFRPVLFRLATESEDDDEGLGEILSCSDGLSRVLSLYDRLIIGDQSNRDDCVLSLLDDVSPSIKSQNSSTEILIDIPQSKRKNEEISKVQEKNELEDLFGPIERNRSNEENLCSNWLESSNLVESSIGNNSREKEKIVFTSNEEKIRSKEKSSSLFDDLNEFLVDRSTGIDLSSTNRIGFDKIVKSSIKPTLNQLTSNKIEEKKQENEIDLEKFPSIQLEQIRPSLKHKSIKLDLKNGKDLECILHIARDSPRWDIIPLVLSVTNNNIDYPIESFRFRPFLSKNVEIKVEEASGDNLPPHNPIVCSSRINQLLIVSNPKKEKIEFGYRIEYKIADKTITDSGFVDEGLPDSIF